MPHFFGNILGKNKIILENGWSNSAFFRPHLKNCYCDKRYLGKWVGDPLKIVQNESVTKKNTCWSTLWLFQIENMDRFLIKWYFDLKKKADGGKVYSSKYSFFVTDSF